MAHRRRWQQQSEAFAAIREPGSRDRCQVRFLKQYTRACEDLRELGPDRSRRSGAGLARAERFFREWQQSAATAEHELSKGRWRYKPLDCSPPVTLRLRQIYLDGTRSVSRAALTVVENESTCIMWFVLAYDKDERDAAIRRACMLVASLSEEKNA